MKLISWSLLFAVAVYAFVACSIEAPSRTANSTPDANSNAKPVTAQLTESMPSDNARIIHVLVALCDNEHQGIVPVPAQLGNGEDLRGNLYWGAAYGVRSFFAKSNDWKLVGQIQNPTTAVLERCIFKNKNALVYLVADAYRGAEIRKAIVDFFDYVSGGSTDPIAANGSMRLSINAGGAADLIAFVGHNGLMDFELQSYPAHRDSKRRGAMILCCASKPYFSAPLHRAGADPILWTNGLMAPEAYVLKAAVDGWIANERGEQIRSRAAQAYNSYQHCGLRAARGLFASGW